MKNKNKMKKAIVKSSDLHFIYNVTERNLIQTLVVSRYLMQYKQMILISPPYQLRFR